MRRLAQRREEMAQTRRHAMLFGAAGVSGVLAAACAPGAPAGPAGSGSTTKATAGPIWILDHPLQLPVRRALEGRVAEFEKAFPGAKVEYDGVVEPMDN